jgi:16S rRNA (cytidine1402-2'-O)-methyltransferase
MPGTLHVVATPIGNLEDITLRAVRVLREGVDLVAAAIDMGIAINPVPGPSAPVAAAMASGFPMVPLSLLGFAPHRASDRKSWLLEALAIPHTLCFFEAPTRIVQTLGQVAEIDGGRPMVIARELTKLHQEFIRGTASELRGMPLLPRGEFTVVLGPATAEAEQQESRSDDQVVAAYQRLVAEQGMTRRAAISATARAYARSSRDVYAAIERAKVPDP